MKIAILICGLTRDCEQASETFKRAFSYIQYDAFLHTWSTDKSVFLDISNVTPKLNKRFTTVEDLTQKFNLKSCLTEVLTDEIVENLTRGQVSDLPEHAVRTLCRYESLKRVFDLSSSCEGYDVVIVTRPDVVYGSYFPNVFEHARNIFLSPRLPNMRDGKRILTKMEAKNPGCVCDYIHDFINVGSPQLIQNVVNFGQIYLDIVNDYPLLNNKYYPDRALAVYLKHVLRIPTGEFILKHGLQRDGRVQDYTL